MNIKKLLKYENEILHFNEIYSTLKRKRIGEPMEVFVPFHNFFWSRNQSYAHYINYLTGWCASKQNINDLLSQSPFKILKIYFTRENKEFDRFKVRCDEDIDLINLFYYAFVPASIYRENDAIDRRMTSVIGSFKLIPSVNRNEFTLPLSQYQIDNLKNYDTYHENTTVYVPLMNVSAVFHSGITFFTTYEDALLSCLSECDRKISSTTSFIKGCNKRFLTQSLEKTKTKKLQFMGSMFQTESNNKDIAILRKLMMRSGNMTLLLKEEFKKNLKKLPDLSDLEKVETLFDYEKWNSIMEELLSFNAFNDAQYRKKIFNQKLISKRINNLKRRNIECVVNEK